MKFLRVQLFTGPTDLEGRVQVTDETLAMETLSLGSYWRVLNLGRAGQITSYEITVIKRKAKETRPALWQKNAPAEAERAGFDLDDVQGPNRDGGV